MKTFTPFRKLLVPIIQGCSSAAVLDAARAVVGTGRIVLVGLVGVEAGASLSAAAMPARQVRKQLRVLATDNRVRSRANVRVSYSPWQELVGIVEEEAPDLLLLDWDCHFEALHTTPLQVLATPPCDLVLVRGPWPQAPDRVLIPARGGPHAELALRLGLSLQPKQLVTLHIAPPAGPGTDAPFRGLEQVLRRLSEVRSISTVTDDPAQVILETARQTDLIVMGATIGTPLAESSLGDVTDRVLAEAHVPVLAVKTRRTMLAHAADEAAGAQAISILVDKWFAENTFQASEFADIENLAALKRAQGLTVSLALPALNEEETVGRVIRTVQRALMEEVPLLDEIVLIDSDSADRTREIAESLGVPVYIHQQLLPELGARPGKGEALWKSLLVTRGDIVAWIDTDIVNIHPRFVYGILGPLLINPRIQFTKGFYRRPLKVGGKTQAGGGGRVTELTARPLLNLFFPELSGVVQPLSGEYAGRREALEQLSFFSGYGVETGLLIDILETYGLSTIAQVDLEERIHHNQALEALSKMSFAIIQAVIRKIENRYELGLLADVNKSMKLIRHGPGGYYLDVEEIAERERPPMLAVPEYQALHLVDDNQPEPAELAHYRPRV